MESIQAILEELNVEFIKALKAYGLKIVVLLILLLIGLRVIRIIVKITEKALHKSKIDISLTKFLVSLVRMALKVSLILLILNALIGGLTPLLAIGAAAGVGIGMALQGSLANFMGGVLILMTRPFSVGDFIHEKAFGNEGTVEGIQVLYTTLLTIDNKTVIIPNGNLANSSITNFSREKLRRIDLIFNVDYAENIQKVKTALLEVANQNPLVLKDHEIFTSVHQHRESGVDFILWLWCESTYYTKLKYELIEQVKLKFDVEGIKIPFPQLDVRITNNDATMDVHVMKND